MMKIKVLPRAKNDVVMVKGIKLLHNLLDNFHSNVSFKLKLVAEFINNSFAFHSV
jgi:hypothetical protein